MGTYNVFNIDTWTLVGTLIIRVQGVSLSMALRYWCKEMGIADTVKLTAVPISNIVIIDRDTKLY